MAFPAEPDLAAQIAGQAAAEQECCSFFTFTVRLTTGQIRLDVRAPVDAADIVAAMFGAAV